ncbi:YusW family protein [Siminovitchia sediminis]|uniref:YusW family protein n=1 Tax=Siminovitchia sediminis TaxID=1274353 RepID=A0ABW4KF02_9BACI
MKKWIYSISIPLFAFGLAACSDDPSIDNHPKEQMVAPDEKHNDNNELIQTSDSADKSDGGNVNNNNPDDQEFVEQFPYKDFDLDIEYSPDMEYDFVYELKDEEKAEYRAILKDSVHDKKLEGVEAFQTLYTLLQDVQLDENTSKEDAIRQILESFQLDDDYTSFELEYTLKDGTEAEFEDKK